MKRLEFMRRDKGLTQRSLGAACSPMVAPADICKAERGRLVLYPGQAQRIADALGWKGDPAELFEEVPNDAVATA